MYAIRSYYANETYFLNPKGFPVGISLPDEELFRKSITLEKIKLKKDDMLLIYTDGVTEAMNATFDEFGVERLQAAVVSSADGRATHILQTILDAVSAFTGGTDQSDDLSLFVVKRRITSYNVCYTKLLRRTAALFQPQRHLS